MCVCVLGVLLYAVETWPIKQRELHSLEVFHHRCLRTILGISRAQQIAQHISNEEVRGRVGMPVSLGDIISNRRFRWLGHLGRMCDSRLPKQILFGWLFQCHPPHAIKLRWRDRVRKDLKHFNISESDWYVVAQDRDKWSQLRMPTPSLSEPVQPRLFCDNCN